ncbi:MAG: hypothetical protein H5T86_01245 [Armatimonadetes bacterium]|nr:hypothetical protein [Armatimonadota bacterium]
MRNALAFVAATLAVVPATADGVELYYSLAPGQVFRYQCELTGNGTATAAGRTDPVVISAKFTYVMEVLDAQDGQTTVRYRVENAMIGATYAGEPLPVAVNIPPVTVVMDRWGRVTSTTVQQPAVSVSPLASLLGGQLFGGGPAGSLDITQFYGQLHMPGFPTTAVRIGETWQEQAQVISADNQPIAVSWQTKLVALTNYAGARCAQLQTSYSLPLSLLVNALLRDVLSLRGDIRGVSTLYFDLDRHIPLAFVSVQESRLSMAAGLLLEDEAQATMSITTHVHAELAKQ